MMSPIEIIISMLMFGNPTVDTPPTVELSRVLHHIDEDVCLGIEIVINDAEWIELKQIKDIEVHRYNVLDIKPNDTIGLHCILHDRFERVIYKDD